MRTGKIFRVAAKAIGLAVFGTFAVATALLFIYRPSPPFPPEGYGKDLPPARLLEDFYSYSTADQVKAVVLARRLHWEMLEPKPTDHVRVARIPNFSHLEMTGELKLYFFRDRLMRIAFKPQDAETYWRRLVDVERLSVEQRSSGWIREAKTTGPVHTGSPYIPSAPP